MANSNTIISESNTRSSAEIFFEDLTKRLQQLDNDADRLTAAHKFMNDTLATYIARSELPVPDNKSRWHYGLFVINEYLEACGVDMLEDLREVEELVKKNMQTLDNSYSQGETATMKASGSENN